MDRLYPGLHRVFCSSAFDARRLLVLLLLTLAVYFAFEERSKLIVVAIVVCGALAFAFFLAMIVLAATDANNLIPLSDA